MATTLFIELGLSYLSNKFKHDFHLRATNLDSSAIRCECWAWTEVCVCVHLALYWCPLESSIVLWLANGPEWNLQINWQCVINFRPMGYWEWVITGRLKGYSHYQKQSQFPWGVLPLYLDLVFVCDQRVIIYFPSPLSSWYSCQNNKNTRI